MRRSGNARTSQNPSSMVPTGIYRRHIRDVLILVVKSTTQKLRLAICPWWLDEDTYQEKCVNSNSGRHEIEMSTRMVSSNDKKNQHIQWYEYMIVDKTVTHVYSTKV